MSERSGHMSERSGHMSERSERINEYSMSTARFVPHDGGERSEAAA